MKFLPFFHDSTKLSNYPRPATVALSGSMLKKHSLQPHPRYGICNFLGMSLVHPGILRSAAGLGYTGKLENHCWRLEFVCFEKATNGRNVKFACV